MFEMMIIVILITLVVVFTCLKNLRFSLKIQIIPHSYVWVRVYGIVFPYCIFVVIKTTS